VTVTDITYFALVPSICAGGRTMSSASTIRQAAIAAGRELHVSQLARHVRSTRVGVHAGPTPTSCRPRAPLIGEVVRMSGPQQRSH
jgi:hypothetical protein